MALRELAMYLNACIANVELIDQAAIGCDGLGNFDAEHRPLVSYILGGTGDVQVTLLGGDDWTVRIGFVR